MSCKTTPRDADVSSQDSGCWSFLENSRHHKTGDKNYGSGSGMARSSPALFPLCLLLWQELHREQESPQSLVTSGESPWQGSRDLVLEKPSLPAAPRLSYRRPPKWA